MNHNIICWQTLKTKRKNHFLLPSPTIRMLIIGRSGCGKTSLLLKMLLENGWLDYNELYVYSKSLHQPEYKILKAGFDKGYSKSDIVKMFNDSNNINVTVDEYVKKLPTKCKSKITVAFYENFESIPDPSELNCDKRSLFIFDDVMLEKKQNTSESFFTRGRHNNCSCIYISQNYHKLPRQTIRTNANVFVLFSQSKKDLQHIHDDYVGSDMSWNEFKQYTEKIRDHSFLVINKDFDIFSGKYIKNFNEVYIPQNYLKNNL